MLIALGETPPGNEGCCARQTRSVQPWSLAHSSICSPRMHQRLGVLLRHPSRLRVLHADRRHHRCLQGNNKPERQNPRGPGDGRPELAHPGLCHPDLTQLSTCGQVGPQVGNRNRADYCRCDRDFGIHRPRPALPGAGGNQNRGERSHRDGRCDTGTSLRAAGLRGT